MSLGISLMKGLSSHQSEPGGQLPLELYTSIDYTHPPIAAHDGLQIHYIDLASWC